MRYIVDISRDNFNRIDFTEAEIRDSYCKNTLPNDFEFTIWGATLLFAPHWKHEKNFLNDHIYDDDMCVCFWHWNHKISNLVGGNIEVYIYDNVKMD